jgi:hypothetical protein
LLATWIIPHLDKNGVFYRDPSIVKSLVFPMRDDIPADAVRQCLDAMESTGLFTTFQAGGRSWQAWPGFRDNQPNLHYEREATDYPTPPDLSQQTASTPPTEQQPKAGLNPDLVRTESGLIPAQSNLNESNVSPAGADKLDQPPAEESHMHVTPQQRAVADNALLKHAGGNGRVAGTWDTANMAENVRARGRAFAAAANVQPAKGKVKDWITSLEESYQVCADDRVYAEALPSLILFAKLQYGTWERPGTLATPLRNYVSDSKAFKDSLRRLVNDARKAGVDVQMPGESIPQPVADGEIEMVYGPSGELIPFKPQRLQS